MNWLKPYRGRIICTTVGVISVALFLTLGAAKTALILLCCAVGHVVGIFIDKGITLPTIRWSALKPYRGRISCIALGIISAVLFLTLGAAKTALILLFCGISYIIGVAHDKKLHLSKLLFFWKNRF